VKKAIIFDFGQTLSDASNGFRAAEKDAQAKIFPCLGITSWDDFLERYRQFRKAYHEQSDFSRKDMWAQVFASYDIAPDLTLLKDWEDDYWNTVEFQTSLFPEAMETLEKLRAKHLLAMITNTQGQKSAGKHRLSRFPGLAELFHEVLVAGESDVPTKPDPAPFQLCLRRLGILASEAVYVGDDWRIDICGASNVGIQPIWLKHYSVRRAWPVVETEIPVITSLDRLLNLNSIIPQG